MRRVLKALISNGLFSVMSLILSILIGQRNGTDDLGLFGIAFAAYALIQLIVRDAGANTLSPLLPARRRIRATAARISFLGMLFAVPVIAAGLFLNSTYMLIIGLATHGICLYDYSKTLSLSLDDGKVALAQDGLLFLFFSVGAVLTWIGVIPAIALVAIWALAGAVIGYAAAALQCYRLWPRWSGDPDELRTSIGFGVQGLIGGGSVHVSTFLLALVGGANIVGSIRGASTLIGPANLVTSSLQPLLISYFSRTAPRAGEISMPSLFKSAAGMVCVQLFLAGALTLVGYFFGDVLLGPVWQDSEPLLVIVAVDAVLVAAGAAPLAAHRTLWKSGRLARINSCMVVMRLTLVIFGALLWGAQGAALGLLTVTLVGSVIWWTSIIQLRDH